MPKLKKRHLSAFTVAFGPAVNSASPRLPPSVSPPLPPPSAACSDCSILDVSTSTDRVSCASKLSDKVQRRDKDPVAPPPPPPPLVGVTQGVPQGGRGGAPGGNGGGEKYKKQTVMP